MKKKKNYKQPETTVQRVELESPICSGSVNIVNNPDPMGINAQQTNQTFDAGSQTSGGDNTNGWDYTGN